MVVLALIVVLTLVVSYVAWRYTRAVAGPLRPSPPGPSPPGPSPPGPSPPVTLVLPKSRTGARYGTTRMLSGFSPALDGLYVCVRVTGGREVYFQVTPSGGVTGLWVQFNPAGMLLVSYVNGWAASRSVAPTGMQPGGMFVGFGLAGGASPSQAGSTRTLTGAGLGLNGIYAYVATAADGSDTYVLVYTALSTTSLPIPLSFFTLVSVSPASTVLTVLPSTTQATAVSIQLGGTVIFAA